MSQRGINVRFYLSYIVIGILFVIILGFFIFYFLYYQKGENITMTDVMAYLAGSVAILTLMYHSISIERTDYYHRENLKLSKHQYSYEVVSKLTDSTMSDSIQILNEIREQHSTKLEKKNIKDFVKFLKDNPKKRTKLILILNYFEHMSLLVYNCHVEEHIIKAAFKTLFTSSYSLLKEYIDERQSTHRRSWIKFEELATKWSKEN